MSDKFDKDHASVGGEAVHRSKFAYVGDPEDKSTWKLPIHDESHILNALARFNQADIPADRKKEVARRIVRAAKAHGADTSGFEERYLVEGAHHPLVPSSVEEGSPARAGRDRSSVPSSVEEGKSRPAGRGGTSPVLILMSSRLRVKLGEPVVAQGKKLFEVPIALTGTWVKSGRTFSITKGDLADMVRNFERRKNDQVVVDYEHASEMPEVARGGPVLAAGWIHRLSANGELKALMEWTPQAEEMIRSGQYRFFSPAIAWGARDKESGTPQGATLTSGALTNHPFLEDLPPIMLSDLDIESSTLRSRATAEDGSGHSRIGPTPADPSARASGRRAEGSPTLRSSCDGALRPAGEPFENRALEKNLRSPNDSIHLQEMAGIHQDGYLPEVSVAPGRNGPGQGGNPVKRLTVKKLYGAKGLRRLFDDAGAEVGEISLDELDLDDAEVQELMAKRGGLEPKTAGILSELFADGEFDEASGEELRRLLKPARELGAERVERAARAAVLSETIKDGGISLDVAARLADQGRLTFADYRVAHKAHELIEKAIAAGQFLPADREFISRMALAESERFEAWAKKKPRAVQLGGPAGVGGPTPENPAQDISLRLSELMREKNLNRQKALQELAQTDPELIRRWRWSNGHEADR